MIHVFQFVYILNMWDHPQPSWCTDTQCSCSATLYCSPVLSKQMTGEMMNVVVISPQRCSPGRRGNQWEAPEDRPALYIPATSHTHTHTPTTTAWESQRHLIHHSVCLRKDSERGWGTFSPPLIYMNGQVGVVCSVMYSVLWVWNDPGLNTKTEKMTFIKQR